MQAELERLEAEEQRLKVTLTTIAKRQAPVERIGRDAQAFLETWQDVGELLEAATSEERQQILQHYIEVIELGNIDRETRTGTYALRLFPEVRLDRGFDFGEDRGSGQDDVNPGPETTNGAIAANGDDPDVLTQDGFVRTTVLKSSPTRTRTWNKPVNSRLLYH